MPVEQPLELALGKTELTGNLRDRQWFFYIHLHDFKRFFQNKLPNTEEPEQTINLLPDLDSQARLNEITVTNQKQIILAIGPEGGWVPFEIDLMTEHNFQKFNLGFFVCCHFLFSELFGRFQ